MGWVRWPIVFDPAQPMDGLGPWPTLVNQEKSEQNEVDGTTKGADPQVRNAYNEL